jgi:WD40 repeat protein
VLNNVKNEDLSTAIFQKSKTLYFKIFCNVEVVVGFSSGAVQLVNPDDNSTLTFSGTLKAQKHTGSVNKILRINDINVISASADKGMMVWYSNSGQYVCNYYNNTAAVTSMAIVPIYGTNWMASGSCDTKIKIWDLAGDALTATILGHTDCVTDLAYNPWIGNATIGAMISVSADHQMIAWDLWLSTFNILNSTNLTYAANCLLVLNNGVMITGGPVQLNMWSINFTNILTVDVPNSATIQCMTLLPDLVTLACGLNDSKIILFNMTTNTFDKVLYGHTKKVNVLQAFVFPGNNVTYLISGSDDTYVYFWHMSAYLPVRQLKLGSTQAVKSLYYLHSNTANGKFKKKEAFQFKFMF